MLNRRRFIQVGFSAAAATLYGCSDHDGRTDPVPGDATPSPTQPLPPAGMSVTDDDTSTDPTTALTGPTTEPTAPKSPSPGLRTLVVVQLNGGNDALNTLVPNDGRYRDARPTLAIPEADLVDLGGAADWSLHPSLAPLLPHWDAGHAAFLPGIGFPGPDHSHFVSLDRWWRADDPAAASGWLGRAVAGSDVEPLYATSLGAGAPLLRSDLFSTAVVLQPAGFVLPAVLPESLVMALTAPTSDDALAALAQQAFGSTVEAVESFSSLLAADEAHGDEISYREGGLDLVTGLDLAARLVTGGVGTRIVVVSVGGFDTHSNQLPTHAALLADLADGVDKFMSSVAAAGMADTTMLVTTSEFGRRVGENASGGSDHGAGGLSMMFGPMLHPGVLNGINLGDQLDGDVRPSLDPRTMYTACLDWLGLDAERSLGRRYDEIDLLR